jgi:nitrous oxide reductase accessory protein NosL
MRAHTAFASLVLAGALAAQAVVAGSAIKPVPISPGDLCFRCQRVIADRWVAAEVIGASRNEVGKFRTIRCMLTYLNSALPRTNTVFVTDDQTAKLIDANVATFVPVVIDEHTGLSGYGLGVRDYVAFRSSEVAERFAARHGVKTMSWASVVFEVHTLIDINESKATD